MKSSCAHATSFNRSSIWESRRENSVRSPSRSPLAVLPSLLVHTANVQCFYQQFDPEALEDDQALAGLIDLYLHGVLAPSADRD